MIVKLLAEHHLEFLSLKVGCRGSPESTLVKMSNRWKSHAAAHLLYLRRVVLGPCFAVLSCFLVLHSFRLGTESWLLFFCCVLNVMSP